MNSRTYLTKTPQILEAAEELFMRDGYARTSMNSVAQRADVAKQTLYSNFSGKQQLFAAVIGRRSNVDFELPSRVSLDAVDLRTALVELATAFLVHIYSPRQIELFRVVVAESQQFPELGELMLNGPFVETPHLITAVLRDRTSRGELRLTDVEEATALFTALLKAEGHSRLLFNQQVNTSLEHLREFAMQAVDLFLDGARPR